MPNPLVIAAVTAVLKSRLENGLAQLGAPARLGGDVIVSALPPDRVAVGADERMQLNLFLHQVTPNTSRRGSAGATPERQPPALDLHYLLTAYGAQDYQIEALLGYGVALMHAMQLLPRNDFHATLAALTQQGAMAALFAVPDLAALDPQVGLDVTQARADRVEVPDLAALDPQVGQLAITPQFLNTEELSRLWSALQARYRPSLAYKVALAYTKEQL